MRMLIIFYREEDFYKPIKYEPLTIKLLADFLTDDVGGRTEDLIGEFLDNEYHEAAMNATQFSKENGIVTITPEYIIDEEESIAIGNFFSIKAMVLAELLRQWRVAYLHKPPYILITIEGDVAQVKGSESFPNYGNIIEC